MPVLLPLGSNLRGRYKIHRTLHQSQFCNLYIAQDQHLRDNKYWVIKEISSVGLNPADRNRMASLFQAEAYLVTALEHPNLPKLIDFFSQGTNFYLVREFISGSDLATLLESKRILPETDIINIGIQLCDLVSYLQSKKFTAGIHKNLKLSNIVMMPDGRIAMLDVGFNQFGSYSRDSMRAPDYAAPEQFTGEMTNENKTLVYNIGAILYHLFTNFNPSTSAFNLPPMETIRQGITPAAKSIVEKATRNHPSDRPATVQELRKSLSKAFSAAARRAGETGITSIPQVPGASSSGPPTWVWVVGMLLTALIGAALVVVFQTLS